MRAAGRERLQIPLWDSQAVPEHWEMDPWGTLGGMDAEEKLDHRPAIIVIIYYYYYY